MAMRWVLVVLFACAVTACGGGGVEESAPPTTVAESETTAASPSDDEGEAEATSSTAVDDPEPDADSTDDGTDSAEDAAAPGTAEDDSDADSDAVADAPAPEPIDWLTFARGLTFVRLSGLNSGSAGTALDAVNGDDRSFGVTTDEAEPVEFVFELPALTTFERLAVPNILDQPGNSTAVRFLTVEGSAEGPDGAWEVLADTEFELHAEEGQVTELELLTVTPVRWLRLTMSGGIVVEEGDEGRTTVRFSELIGNGVQEPMETADFTGRWEFDLTERPDFDGDALQIVQTGSTIHGCWADVVFSGSVNGRIARATGLDIVRDRPVAFIFVSDADDGAISALVSVNNAVFTPYLTTVNEDIGGCLEGDAPEPVVCETSVYINFDVNSAVIRAESEGVLADLYDQLSSEGGAVSIVGHTSTEGDADYNLDLSARRAQAVVDDLVSRGLDPAGISAEGRGETEPLVSPDDTETAREINRRVDILCG